MTFGRAFARGAKGAACTRLRLTTMKIDKGAPAPFCHFWRLLFLQRADWPQLTLVPFGALPPDFVPVFSLIPDPEPSCWVLHATTVRPVDPQRYATFFIHHRLLNEW
jgi:hypothetical protein